MDLTKEQQKIQQNINSAISRIQCPKDLVEDARQEGWVAVGEGKEIITHLKYWLRSELKVRANMGLTEGLEDPCNMENRLDHRIDEVKSI